MPKKGQAVNIENVDLAEDEVLLAELPEQHAIREYTKRRFGNLLTPDNANALRVTLQNVYRTQMQDAEDPLSADYRRANFKLTALSNGWTPEDMPVMDALFDAAESDHADIRVMASEMMEEIRNSEVHTVSARSTWLTTLAEFSELVEKSNIPSPGLLRTAVTNASERNILPTEYPQDEDFLQSLADEDKFTIQYYSTSANDPVHAASSMLQNRMEEYRKGKEGKSKKAPENSTYVMPKTSAAGDENFTRNLAQVEHKMTKSNRQAAKEVFGSEVYDTIDEARKGSVEDRTVPLHNSVGTKQAAAGDYVFEVDFAGTSFTQTHRDHHGLDGWFGDLASEGGKDQKLKDLLDLEYGPIVEGKSHVREKDTKVETADGRTVTKKRLTLSGPNTFDNNEYSIANNTQYASEKLKGYISEIIADYRTRLEADPKAELPNIQINITGHSRGAVAAGETAQTVADWVANKAGFGDLAKYVKITPILRDPVPGRPGYDPHAVNDMSGLENLSSTVFYALSQEHSDYYFEPQLIKGADRIVFGVMPHSTALDGADYSQMTVAEDAMAHKRGFYDASTGEFYRGSGLSELPKGMYFADDRQNLIRVDSWSQIDKLADASFEDGKGLQPRRLNIIRRAAKDWFLRNDLDMSYTSMEQREQAVENLDRTKKAVLESKDKTLSKLQSGLKFLAVMENSKNTTPQRKMGILDDIKTVCRDCMKDIEPGTPENNAKLAMLGDLLSGVQKERNYLDHGPDKLKVNERKELAGGAKRQQDRDSARMDKIVAVQNTLIHSAVEAQVLLDRLEATKKSGTNSGKYNKMHDALKRISDFDSSATINDAAKAFSDLQKACNDYNKDHKGNLFRSDDGVERKEVARLGEILSKKYSETLKEQTQEIPNKDSKLGDLISRQGSILQRSQEKVKSLKLADLEQRINPAPKQNGNNGSGRKRPEENSINDEPEKEGPVKDEIVMPGN